MWKRFKAAVSDRLARLMDGIIDRTFSRFAFR